MGDNERLAREILEKVCETDEIFEDYEMDLVDEGFIDSFALLSVILEIEKRTGLKLQPTDIKKEDISSINSLIKFLENNRWEFF